VTYRTKLLAAAGGQLKSKGKILGQAAVLADVPRSGGAGFWPAHFERL
jgi:hypothetical protein